MKLEISLFRFDYKSDYLPYYTKNFIKVDKQKTLLDILNTINQEYPFGYEKSTDFNVVVNGVYLTLGISIDELVDNFGKDLTIEPISIRRAHTDLLINQADFEDRLKVLSEFIDEEDKKIYEDYKIYFYASNTINYEYDYIGDSILLLAYDLIEKNPSNEKEILEALNEYECSASYHTSLQNRVYKIDSSIEEKISKIKNKLGLTKSVNEQDFFLEKKNTIDFGIFDETKEIKHDFSDFNLAYFKGIETDEQTNKLIANLNPKIINTPLSNIDLALDTFHLNSDFTMKLASNVMLEAFDNGADLIIVDDENIFNLFDSNRRSLENACGREIPIPVLHKNELQKLACAEHESVKESLSKHIIDPEII